MAIEFRLDVDPNQIFRINVVSPDQRWVRVLLQKKTALNNGYVALCDPLIGPFEYRDVDLPVVMRLTAKVLFPLHWRDADIEVSKAGPDHWILNVNFSGRTFAMARIDLITIDAASPYVTRSDADANGHAEGEIPHTFSNSSVVLELSKTGESKKEGLVVDGKGWRSPGGGWLGAQSGGWISLPDGLHLNDGSTKTKLVICRGLIFATCKKGDVGPAIYDTVAEGGSWKVIDTI